MRTKHRNNIIISLSLLAAITIFTVSSVNAAFKDVGWGARPTALGGAFTAVSDDSNGILYNPAGMVQADGAQVSFMYAKLFYGLDEVKLGLNYGAFIIPVNKIGTFGVNWANFMSTDQYREDIITLSYAKRLNDIVAGMFNQKLVPEVSFGINVKYLMHEYVLDERTRDDDVFAGGNSKSKIAVDLGIWSRPLPSVCSGLSLGVMLKNINQPDVGLNTKDIVPMETRVAMAYKLKKLGGISDILTSVDFSYRNQEWGSDEDKINIHAGMEAWAFNKILGLRLGGNYTELTSGFALRVPEKLMLNLQLDYTFIWPIYVKETLGTHRVSLTYQF